MDFLSLAKKRHSVRQYEDRPVEKEVLLQILEAGRVAPTAVNKQPQRILVVESKDGLEKLKKAANCHGAPLALIVCADKSEVWTRPYDGHTMVDIDASIVTDHMMLATADLGLGSCWLTYFKPEVLKEEFAIPNSFEPVNILAVGYPKEAPQSPGRHDSKRKPLEQTVFYESWATGYK